MGRLLMLLGSFAAIVLAQPGTPVQGIPVREPLVIAKCGACHSRDQQGNMQRISWERSTPEGWQDALKRMVVVQGVSLTPPEARAIVKYLSAEHGLAPEEAKAVAYDAERRFQKENIPNDRLDHACARCHSFARSLAWRRSADDWKQFVADHGERYKLPSNEEAVEFLSRTAPLDTPEWQAWSARSSKPNVAGRWLVTATLRGHGKFYGDLELTPGEDGEFTTTAHLTSVDDGTRFVRTGRGVVYSGCMWRGRSQGPVSEGAAADSVTSQAREALSISSDGSTAQGRWFWGQYQEFGFEVKLRRATAEPSLLLLDRASLKVGSQSNAVRLIGDQLPAHVAPSDLNLGPGVTVRSIVSNSSSEIKAQVDVSSDAPLGRRDVSVGRSVLPGAMAVYDRVDYIKLSPESAMAAFADPAHARGFQQFEAVGYQRGPDGKLHTSDDVELGPIDPNEVTWSLEVFYATPGANTDFVGKIGSSGAFTPADQNPKANFDVWVAATSKSLTANNGRPLVGKAYMVVTVPSYTLNGRRYVRDLDRWVDDGPAQ
jgi:quinohemoprotein amine dehydrogenase